jgi:hypothetical protein
VISVKCELFDFDFLRWNFTKLGSEMRVFQELLTHLNRRRDFTGSNDKNSAKRSSGTDAHDGAVGGDMADCEL